MASLHGFGGIDMNNLVTLGHYSQMLLFKNNTSQEELLFYHPSSAEQRTLQSLAHNLELEYEYSVVSQTARILRSVAPQSMSPEGFEYFDFDQFHFSEPLETSQENSNHPNSLEASQNSVAQGNSNNDEISGIRDLVASSSLTTPPPTQTPSSAGPTHWEYDPIDATAYLLPVVPCVKALHQSGSRTQPSTPRCVGNSNATADTRPSYQPSPRRDSSVLDGSIGPLSYTPSKLSSRKGSIYSNASAGYQEIVFDSNSIYSDGQVSNASVGSGRRGPLSEMARVGMNAVKQVGACWRCKFLRNRCDPNSPCALCPSGEKSKWAAVGCRRGRFSENLQPIDLCFRPHFLFAVQDTERSSERGASDFANRIFRHGSMRREAWLLETATSRTIEQETRQMFLQNIANQANTCSRPPNPARLQPLEHCVLAIVWELLERPLSLPAIDSEGTFEKIGLLLPSAAVYQATCESDSLIAQSLICLRSCLEVLRVQISGTLSPRSHQDCYTSCKVECVSNLNMNCSLYLGELNRVFFKKENLRNRNHWWLSAFYSFCIQALVRKAMIKIIQDPSVVDVLGQGLESYKRYMQLPVRLFIASCSSHYDPMVEDTNQVRSSSVDDDSNQTKTKGTPSFEDLAAARLAVGHAKWALGGITNSCDFLKIIFEDDGNEIENSSRGLPPASQSTMDQFSSKSPNPQILHKCKVCDKEFTRPSFLLKHMKTHNGEKPFSCEVDGCGRHFAVVSNLRRHQRVHMGDTRSEIRLEDHQFGFAEFAGGLGARNDVHVDQGCEQNNGEAILLPCQWCLKLKLDCDKAKPRCGQCKIRNRVVCFPMYEEKHGEVSHQKEGEKRKRTDSQNSRSKPLPGRFRSLLHKTAR